MKQLLSGHTDRYRMAKRQAARDELLLHAAMMTQVTIKASAKSASLRPLIGKARKEVVTIGT